MRIHITGLCLLTSTLLGLNTQAEQKIVTPFIENFVEAEENSPHEHDFVLNPEQERKYYEEAMDKSNFELLDFRFSQESWFECTDDVTGNFYNYKCAKRRGISSILKSFIHDHMGDCVQEALGEMNGSQVETLHIVHDGILGDRRHAKRSLHAENRAIDIKSFKVTFTDGTKKEIVYADKRNREFFTKFRACWGEVVKENNDCPLYKGNPIRTGSIGWEDRNHQYHMHTSVPYCINGTYGSYYYKR